MAFIDLIGWFETHRFLGAAIVASVYRLGLVVYRVYFSPLAKFPGPKLAAATSLYNAYYDLIKGGQYIWAIEDMHRKYGPIVRIRPDALHINDPTFIDKLYPTTPKVRRNRGKLLARTLMVPGATVGTEDYELHRLRKSVMNPFFSQKSIREIEPLINETLSKLLRRMENWAQEGKPVELSMAFKATTKDIIQTYAFGDCNLCLDMEDLDKKFFDMVKPAPVNHIASHFPWARMLADLTPPAILSLSDPRFADFVAWFESLNKRVVQISQTKDYPEGRTIFYEIFRRNDIPSNLKDTKRLGEEALVLHFAGTDSTSFPMAALTYHLLSDRELLAKLRAELEEAMPDPNEAPSAAKLERLPFLNALINEALRLYPGGAHRQDRTAPDEDLVYEIPSTLPRAEETVQGKGALKSATKAYTIPAGTVMGMTAPLINRHPDLYDQPEEFLPERYLENPRLVRHLMTFSKGAMQCIGMSLAYQELQAVIAGIFRRYNSYDPNLGEGLQGGPTLEIYQTEREDIAVHADFVNSALRPGSVGLRVIVRH